MFVVKYLQWIFELPKPPKSHVKMSVFLQAIKYSTVASVSVCNFNLISLGKTDMWHMW